jgi:hypothetical protein
MGAPALSDKLNQILIEAVWHGRKQAMRLAVIFQQFGTSDPLCRGAARRVDRNGFIRSTMDDERRNRESCKILAEIRFAERIHAVEVALGLAMTARMNVQFKSASLTGLLTKPTP